MSDLDEMDSERLNELESILYASIHYSDHGSGETGAGEITPSVADQQATVDAQHMPPPPQQAQRIVSEKRVINNAVAKPRYWAEEKEAAPNVGGTAGDVTSTSTSTSTDMEVDKPNGKRPSLPNRKETLNSPKPAQPKQQSKAKPSPKQQPKPEQKEKSVKESPSPKPQPRAEQRDTRWKSSPKPQAKAEQKPKPAQKPQPQAEQKPKSQQQQQQQADDEPERFDQKLLVAIPPNWPPKKQKGKQQQQVKAEPGPFSKANRKLLQMERLAAKKLKSKQALANKKQRKPTEPVAFVDLGETSNDDDDDDVILVPLPPVPVIDLDASDTEQNSVADQYHEENAMDAADVEMSISCITQPEAAAAPMTPPLNSPCNSVMSSDDFIVQKDTSRLLEDRARATDEDLLVLTENAIREAAGQQDVDMEQQEPEADADAGADVEAPSEAADQAAETSSEYEFVPPSRLEEIKQNYRVDDHQQYRALDVYESESDLTESGIYSKVKPKATPTIIRSVESPSDSSDVAEVVEPNVNKMKRLRKRRSSSTNQSQSEPNNDDDEEDTDSEDGVQPTGVPGIARGMAVERCKRKIRRLSARRSSEDVQKKTAAYPRIANLKPIHESTSNSASEEDLPSARAIAERLLQQEQAKENGHGQAQAQAEVHQEVQQLREAQADDQLETLSIGSDADSQHEAEFNNAVTDRVLSIFERVDAADTRKITPSEMTEAISEEEDEADTTMPAEDYPPAEDDHEEEQLQEDEFEAEPTIKVEHNLTELTDDPVPTSGQLVGWNEEMCCFYNDSWHGENFNLQKIQRAMNGRREEWKISNEDRYPVVRHRSRAKCTNCAEMGHMRSKCPRPRKPLVCHMCGKGGHAEPRCPNAICLGCGAKQAIYVQQCNKCSFHSRLICQLCKMRGHGMDHCPDKWRRYHSTIRSNVPLQSKVTYTSKQCSYCAGRGHLFENCRLRIGEFRSQTYSSHIVSHQKTYKDRSGNLGYLGHLTAFYANDTPFSFAWSDPNIPKNSYYARFLLQTNLAQPQSSQRKVTLLGTMVEVPKVYTHDYVPNAQAKAARGQILPAEKTVTQAKTPKAVPEPEQDTETELVTETQQITEPEQLPEPDQEEISEPDQTMEEEQSVPIQREEISTSFEAQPEEAAKPVASTGRQSVGAHELDSDSNYSFSEHFELPTSTTSDENDIPPMKKSRKNTLPMGPMPDIIPLSGGGNDDEFNISSNSQGISMCVNSRRMERMDDGADTEMPDVPCEGKIIMARDLSEYLFSPEGWKFLTETAKQCQVTVRMDLIAYGYVLVIYGLKENQEDLQLKLLHRHQEVKRRTVEFQTQKPPKRVDVLIRFLRDGIISLNSNLGNAKALYRTIKQQENLNTKNGFKLAEKKRRQLNMILVGQAGLLNGGTHLDQLLVLLQTLLKDFSPDDNASPAMRTEIEEHWRMIFTAYPHPKYEELLDTYLHLDLKNRLPTMNIDPMLLGLPPLHVGRGQPTPQASSKRAASPTPPPPAWQHMAPPPPPKQKAKQQRASATQAQQQQQQRPGGAGQAQRQQRTGAGQTQQQQRPGGAGQSQQQQQRQGTGKPQQQQRPGAGQQLQRPGAAQPQKQQRTTSGQQQQQQQRPGAGQQQQRPGAGQQQQRPGVGQQQQQQSKRGQPIQMPFNNPQQRARADLQLRNGIDPDQQFARLLGEVKPNACSLDANKPSVFWSRESLRYIDELFKITTRPDMRQRLNRVLQRSRNGELSHNDYRAVIDLHMLLSNQ